MVRVPEGSYPRSEVRIAAVTGDVGVVVLLGEHDMSTATEIRSTVESLLQSGVNVVVDLTETEFIDSSTFHALEEGLRLAPRHGARMGFHVATQRIVERLLGLTGALAEWPVYRTRADAIRAVRSVSDGEATASST